MRAAHFAAFLSATLVSLAAPCIGAPKVAADIPPVHALAAQVMQGVGAPELIVAGGASPHGFALRPSQARRIAEADLIIWMGPALTPWLERAAASLAPDAVSIPLLAQPETETLPIRDSGVFEPDHDHAAEEDHGGDDAIDPHAWLDPENARRWLALIARALARIDPENAAAYAANAAVGAAELAALEARIDATLAPARGRGFIVFHDSYQYFERRFRIPAAGAVSLGDAARPGAARIARIRTRIEEAGVDCVFSEPQFQPRLVAMLVDGTPARAGVLDPLGAGLSPGAGLYPALLEGLAANLAACLKDPG